MDFPLVLRCHSYPILADGDWLPFMKQNKSADRGREI